MFPQCSITTGYEPVVALSKILTAPPTSLVLGTPRSLVSAAQSVPKHQSHEVPPRNLQNTGVMRCRMKSSKGPLVSTDFTARRAPGPAQQGQGTSCLVTCRSHINWRGIMALRSCIQ